MKRQPDPLQKRPPSFSRSLVTLCSSRSSSASFLLPLSLSLSPSHSLPLSRIEFRIVLSRKVRSRSLSHHFHILLESVSFPLHSPLPSPLPVPRSSSIQPRECPWRGPPPRLSSFRVTHRIQVLGEGTEGRGGGYSRQGSSRRAPENKISCPLYASGRGKWRACGGRGGEKRTN